jgi:hypothetical protein
MGPLANFMEYAQAFELTFDDDDWSRLERYFAPDAIYEVRNIAFACRIEGREAIFRGIKRSLDTFDRKLPKRAIEVTEPPVEDGDTMTVGMAVTYQKPGAPPLVLRGRVIARYRGEVIAEMADVYDDATREAFERWAREHGAGLSGSYV